MHKMTSNSDDAAAQKEEIIKIIKNTQMNTNKFNSEIISTIDNADDTYRWYLCTQTRPTGWTCERKNAYEILGTAGTAGYMDKPTTMVPVYRFIPSVLDTMIVQHSIRSMTRVKLE